MGQLFSYSIESGIILIFLYLSYKWTMAAERQFSLNRATLLIIYFLAILLPAGYPMLDHIVFSHIEATTTSFGFEFENPIMVAAGNVEKNSSLWLRAALWIYIVGMIVTTIRLIVSTIRIGRVINQGEHVKIQPGYTLVLTDKKNLSPCSFMHFIIISTEDFSKCGSEVLMHEMTHVRENHWIDQMIGNLIAIFLWYNPASWLMIEELKTVHEYQADDSVISSGTDIKNYQYLLIEKAVGKRFPSPANSLNHSKLKKRITMMYKSKPSVMRRLAGILTIPAAVAAIAVTNIPSFASVIAETSDATLSDFSADKVTKNFPEPETSSSNLGAVSSSDSKENVSGNGKDVYVAVEQMAEFPGGQRALMEWLARNIQYPQNAQKNDIQGRVIVKFVVRYDGKITDATIIKGVDPELDQEALRVIGEMPDWIPAKNDGKPVSSYFNLPISFKLTRDDDKKEGN